MNLEKLVIVFKPKKSVVYLTNFYISKEWIPEVYKESLRLAGSSYNIQMINVRVPGSQGLRVSVSQGLQAICVRKLHMILFFLLLELLPSQDPCLDKALDHFRATVCGEVHSRSSRHLRLCDFRKPAIRSSPKSAHSR